MAATSAYNPLGDDDDFEDDFDEATAYDDFHDERDDDDDFDEPQPVEAKPAVQAEQIAIAPPVSKPKRARRFFRWLSRLLMVAIIAGLGIGGYLLWPTINELFIERVENTAADLDTVEGRIDELDSTSANFASTAGELNERLDSIESAQEQANERLDGIDELIAGQNTRIEGLDELAETLSSDLETTNSVATRQLEVTRAAELMSRARLFLFQANYGLAAADLNSAQVTLSALEVDSDVDGNIPVVIERLDRAIANLPDLPVAAAGDLDIAWQTLLGTQETPVLPFRESDEAETAEAEPTSEESSEDEPAEQEPVEIEEGSTAEAE